MVGAPVGSGASATTGLAAEGVSTGWLDELDVRFSAGIESGVAADVVKASVIIITGCAAHAFAVSSASTDTITKALVSSVPLFGSIRAVSSLAGIVATTRPSCII